MSSNDNHEPPTHGYIEEQTRVARRLEETEARTGKLEVRVSDVVRTVETHGREIVRLSAAQTHTTTTMAKREGTPAHQAHERAQVAERVAREAERAARQRATEDADARRDLAEAVQRHIAQVSEQQDVNFAALAAQVASLRAQVESQTKRASAVRLDREAREAQEILARRAREEKILEAAEASTALAAQLVHARQVTIWLLRILVALILIVGALVGIDPKTLHLPMP